MIRNRVLAVLAAAALAAGFGLAFLTHAPNRLVSGQPIALASALDGTALLALLPAVILLVGPFLPQRRSTHLVVALSAAAAMVALCWLAGSHAALRAQDAPPAARTSLGAGFWVLFLCAALALIDTARRLALRPVTGLVIA